MKSRHTTSIAVLLMLGLASAVFAKLPAPSDEAKAKAAEAAAKTAWTGKVDAYLLCKSQDKTAAHYYKTNKAAKPSGAIAPCVNPGPFVYPLPVAAASAAAASAGVGAKPAPVAAAVVPAKKP
jgi:hypothetical protein